MNKKSYKVIRLCRGKYKNYEKELKVISVNSLHEIIEKGFTKDLEKYLDVKVIDYLKCLQEIEIWKKVDYWRLGWYIRYNDCRMWKRLAFPQKQINQLLNNQIS